MWYIKVIPTQYCSGGSCCAHSFFLWLFWNGCSPAAAVQNVHNLCPNCLIHQWIATLQSSTTILVGKQVLVKVLLQVQALQWHCFFPARSAAVSASSQPGLQSSVAMVNHQRSAQHSAQPMLPLALLQANHNGVLASTLAPQFCLPSPSPNL